MNISGSLVQNIVIGVLFLIWVFVMGVGFRNGYYVAQARYVNKTTAEILKSFKYFYSDQGRYPTETEFTNSDIMGMYVFPFPPLQFASGVCDFSFSYGQDTTQSFRLLVCVPKAFANLKVGFNQFTQ